MTMTRFATAVSTILVASALAGPAAAQETKLLFNLFLPKTYSFTTGMFVPWAKNVEKATDGRVKVEFTASSLAPPARQFDMISKGIADVAFTVVQVLAPRVELPQLAELPFSSPVDDAEINSVALWRTYQKFLKPANEFKGVKVLALWTITGNQLFNSKHPVTKIEDMKGLKLRTQPGYAADFIASLGSVVVAAPAAQAYVLLSKGVIDGTLIGSDSVLSFKLTEFLPYATFVPGSFYHTPAAIIMNERKFKSLSEADQKAVDSVSGEAYAHLVASIQKELLGAEAALTKAGTKIVRPDTQFVKQLKDAAKPLYDTWYERAKKKGVDGPAALAYYQQQVEALSKAK